MLDPAHKPSEFVRNDLHSIGIGIGIGFVSKAAAAKTMQIVWVYSQCAGQCYW